MYFPVSQCVQLLNDNVCKTYDFLGIFRQKCRSCSFHVRVTIPKKCADDKLVHILVRPKGNPTTKKELFLALRQNILKHGRFWKCHTYLFFAKELNFNVRDIVFMKSIGQKRYEESDIDQNYDFCWKLKTCSFYVHVSVPKQTRT